MQTNWDTKPDPIGDLETAKKHMLENLGYVPLPVVVPYRTDAELRTLQEAFGQRDDVTFTRINDYIRGEAWD